MSSQTSAAWTARLRKWIAALIVLAAGLALLLGFLGEVHRYFDILAHLRWHFAGAFVGGLAALLVTRRAVALLIVVAGLTLAGPALQAERVARSPGPAAALGEIKILSYNTLHRNDDFAAMEAMLRAEDADVVLLHEIATTKDALLRRLRDLYPHQGGCHRVPHCRVALLSKRPWRTARYERRWAETGPPHVVATFGRPDGPPLTIIGAHVMRPIDSPRRHVFEFGRLARVVRAAPGVVVVVGDMNATLWSASLQGFLREAHLEPAAGWRPSWPAGGWLGSQLAIDHVLASPGVDITDIWLGDSSGSDHRPIVATVRVPPG